MGRKNYGMMKYKKTRREILLTNVIAVTDFSDPQPDAGSRLLKDPGFKTAAMALREGSVSVDGSRLANEEKLAIVPGTEGDGLAADTIAACDYTVRIPIAHGVDSLNAAAASSAAFWQRSLH